MNDIARDRYSSTDAGRDQDDLPLRQSVYDGLRHRLITGKLAPDSALSTRTLAQQLGVSQMPVRDALSRLATEGALEIRSKRRVTVPAMSRSRFEEILRIRLLLEPAAAVAALPFIDPARMRALRLADADIRDALLGGDVDAYMDANFRFHALIYRAPPPGPLDHMIEMLWTQLGPFMRIALGRHGTARLIDRHLATIEAIAAKDAAALEAAIRQSVEKSRALAGDTVVQDGADG